MENELSERRRFARHPCALPVQLHAVGQDYPISGETTDISLGGCYVKLLFPLAAGTVVEIRIGMDGRDIKARGTIKTVDPTLGTGIEFTEMDPYCQHELQLYLEAIPEVSSDSSSVICLDPPYKSTP